MGHDGSSRQKLGRPNSWLVWRARLVAFASLLWLSLAEWKILERLYADPASRAFIDQLESYVRFSLPYYVQEGKSYLTVAIGCTGGRHRSVMIAERLHASLRDVPGTRVRVKHRDIRRSSK